MPWLRVHFTAGARAQVQHGEMGEGFFDDGEQEYFGSDSDEEVQAPLKQKRGGAKLPSKKPGARKKGAAGSKSKKAPAKKAKR